MIRILYALNGIFHKGGTEAVVLNILKHIDQSRFCIDFLVHGSIIESKDNKIQSDLLSKGYNIYHVTPRNVSLRKNLQDIRAVLSKSKYDIVHSHMDAAGYFLLKEAKKMGIATRVAHSHNTGNEVLSGGVTFKKIAHYIVIEYAKYMLRKTATYFIGCSDLAGKWLFGNKICSGNRYMMFRNAIDVNAYRFDASIRSSYRIRKGYENNLIIGHIGRFDKQKNHQFLIEIFERILMINPKSKLLLVGKGILENDIKALVSSKNMTKNVEFLGVMDNIHELLCSMDVMIFPSLFEGLPVTLVEAQAAGLKILASDRISNEVLLTDDICLKSIQSSADEWASCAIEIAMDSRKTDNAVDMIRKGFDMSHNVKLLENKYMDLVKGK